jgi:hypothetical protein
VATIIGTSRNPGQPDVQTRGTIVRSTFVPGSPFGAITSIARLFALTIFIPISESTAKRVRRRE